MLHQPSTTDQIEQVYIVQGLKPQQAWSVPSWPELRVSAAAYTDRWHLINFSEPQSTKPTLDLKGDMGNLSTKEERYRWVNLIWAALSLLIVAGVAFVLWRNRRTANPKTWEAE